MREKPTTSSIIASLAALAGVALMVGFGTRGGLTGDLLALGMTWSMASTMVIARNYPDIPILLTACISSLLSGLLAWPFGAPLAVTGHELLLLALFGIVNFAIGLPLFTYGAKLLPAIETALIGAVDAPLAPFWVWLAFGEVPGMSTIIGGTLGLRRRGDASHHRRDRHVRDAGRGARLNSARRHQTTRRDATRRDATRRDAKIAGPDLCQWQRQYGAAINSKKSSVLTFWRHAVDNFSASQQHQKRQSGTFQKQISPNDPRRRAHARTRTHHPATNPPCAAPSAPPSRAQNQTSPLPRRW